MQPYLDEKTIRIALEKGFITSKEAREMLLAYLQKEKFTPIRYKALKLHQVA